MASSQIIRRASDQEKEMRCAMKEKTPPDIGEALVTEWPYEVVGENLFWQGLN
jgi:hypothetical protein